MQDRNQQVRLIRAVLIGLAATIVSLDLFTTIGGLVAPDAVARFMCSVRSLGSLSRPFIRSEWFAYVSQQCESHALQPVISIINFMIKTSLAAVGTAIFLAFAATVEVQRRRSRVQEVDKHQREVAAKQLKDNSTKVLTLAVIMTVAWMGYVYGPPQKFGVWITDKIVEDFQVLGLTIVGILLYSFFYAFFVWATLRISVK